MGAHYPHNDNGATRCICGLPLGHLAAERAVAAVSGASKPANKPKPASKPKG